MLGPLGGSIGMRITVPTLGVAVPSRDLSERSVTRIRGHRQRQPFYLPSKVNAAITGLVGLAIAMCVLLQM